MNASGFSSSSNSSISEENGKTPHRPKDDNAVADDYDNNIMKIWWSSSIRPLEYLDPAWLSQRFLEMSCFPGFPDLCAFSHCEIRVLFRWCSSDDSNWWFFPVQAENMKTLVEATGRNRTQESSQKDPQVKINSFTLRGNFSIGPRDTFQNFHQRTLRGLVSVGTS